MGILGVEPRVHAPRRRPLESGDRCPSGRQAEDGPAMPRAGAWSWAPIETKSASERGKPKHEPKVVLFEMHAELCDGHHEESRASTGSSPGGWGAK